MSIFIRVFDIKMSQLPTSSSRLPAPSSRLQQPSGLRGPGSATKRRASGDDDCVLKSPEKKSRLGISKDDTRMGSASISRNGTKNVQPRRAGASMRRSVSMSNIAASGINNKGKVGAASNYNFASKGTSSATKPPRRPPVANITNRINNAVPASKTSLPPRPKQDDAAVKGKSKRAAWDVKGRLLDMEAAFREVVAEKNKNQEQFLEYDARIKNLEVEKVNLNQDLQQTHQASQAHRDEVDKLTEDLRRTENDSQSEREELQGQIKTAKSKIEELEDHKTLLERQIKNSVAELNTKLDEIVQLKSKISKLTSASAGMEAILSSTKQVLSGREMRVAELEATVEALNNKVVTMEDKITEGETARRHLHNQVQELKGNIRVFCRVRPLLPAEVEPNGDSTVIHHINILDEKMLELFKGDPNSSSMSGLKSRGGERYEFSYDRMFGPEDGQDIVFDEISQLVQSALDGYNVCIFAYGQTGSGKTYTMEGSGNDNPATEGMIPRTVKQIFSAMEQIQEKGWSYTVVVNFLEIYNENIRDLLAPKESQNQLHEIKRVDKNTEEVYVTNLTSEEVTNEGRVYHLLHTASKARAVATTNMNERSSRSHSVFQLKLSGHNSRSRENCNGTLSLIDLAGSERLKESGSEGQRLTETQSINKSLSSLGNVIMALGQKAPHIPYRNSKLTHLLSGSLGGNSKTLMFVNISPLHQCYNETLNSLRFATKVNNCHIGTATKQNK